MKIGIVGGTGEIGEGLAMRLAPRNDVVIGSREAQKASASSTECMGILRGRGTPCILRGVTNQEAIDHGEVVILAIPFTHLAPTVSSLTGLEKKLVISPVNPMQKAGIFFFAPPPEGSAALLLQKLLPPGTPIDDLCGVGVSFKLAQALYRALSQDESELEEHLDLVALGTAADIVR